MVNTLSFQQNICRTCLCKISASDSIQIFSDKQFYNGQTISQVFQEITQTLMDAKEMLPNNVCLKCAEKLKRTIAFKRNIEKADRTLRYKLRLIEVRHSMKKIDSITSALDALCNELNEICDEYVTSNTNHINDKPPEVSTATTKYNIKQKPVDFNKPRAWQQDNTIVNQPNPLIPKNNSIVKITNKILNPVKQITPDSNCTNNKIKKPVNNNKNDSENTNGSQLNTNLKNCKNQPVPKTELLVKHTDVNVDPLFIPEISKVYSANSNSIKKKQRSSPQQNYSAFISGIIKSAVSDAIILIEDTENSDISEIIQLVQDKPIVLEISDEEEEMYNSQKNKLGTQKNNLTTKENIPSTQKSNLGTHKNNTENSDISEIIQLVEDEPIVLEISDEEEEMYNSQKNKLGTQKNNLTTHENILSTQKSNLGTHKNNLTTQENILCTQKQTPNLEKENINLSKENHNPENRKSNVEINSNLEKKCDLCNTNQKQCRFEEDLSWIDSKSNLLQSQTFTVDSEKLSCGKCDKKFTNAHFLQRHLLYHSLKLEPTDQADNQNNKCSGVTMAVAEVYKKAEQISTSIWKTYTTLQKEPITDITDHTYNRTLKNVGCVSKSFVRRAVPDPNTQQVIDQYAAHNYPAASEPLNVTKEECKYCKTLIKEVDLHRHIVREHKAVYKRDLKRFFKMYYKCNQCPFGRNSAPKKLIHMTTQHVAKFKCNHCEKIFPTRHQLMIHIHRSHSIGIRKTLLCHICGKLINYTSSSMHMQTHTNTKSIKCTVEGCDAMLKYKSSLRDHIMNIHGNEKPFICEHCGKQFVFRRSLMQHIHIHLDVLPYSCVICEKGFVVRSHLKKHLMSHQPTKPYTCPICPQTFGHKHSIKKHCIRYHPEHELAQKKPQHHTRHNSVGNSNSTEKTIECTLCKRNFAYEYNLKKHNRTFHPTEYFNLKRKQLNNDSTIEEIIDQEKNYFKNFLS